MQAQSFFIQQILLGVLLPAVSCGLSFLLFRRIFEKHILTLSISIGFLAAYLNLSSIKLYPLTIQQWLPYLVLFTLIVVILEHLLPFFKDQRWLQWLVRLVLLNLWLYSLFSPFLQGSLLRPARWTVSILVMNFIVISLVVVLFTWLLERLHEQHSVTKPSAFERMRLLLAMIIVGTASSVSIALSHSLVTAQLVGALTAALGAAMVITWFWNTQLAKSSLPVISIILIALILNAYYFASLPLYTTLLIIASPALLLTPFQSLGSLKTRSIMQFASLSVISVISIFLTLLAS